ncbi:MAG: hypothetical protein G01um101424_69 [Parcubacteria group bacterium Gr01-1014_24]|nr:MAG: hypothetical protein G01um101424_69 [Parcubacteria group bacterium Gr01-1014_24]
MSTDEESARSLLVSQGFKKFTLTYDPDALLGMRWWCSIRGVWAPVLHGRAEDWGFTAMDAVLKALACGPRRE